MGLRPGGLHPAPELQGMAFQLSLRAGAGVGGGFSGGAGTFRRQKCLSLEGWDQEVSRLTGRNLEECPAGPDGSPSGSPRPHLRPSPLSPLMQVLLWPGPWTLLWRLQVALQRCPCGGGAPRRP